MPGDIARIREMPTLVSELEGHEQVRVHESCLRAFHILQKVVGLLSQGTPGPVVLEIIAEMQAHEPPAAPESEVDDG